MQKGQKIRVCHLVNSLDAGGMENGVVNIISKLTGDEFEFHVLCLERRGPFADRLPKSSSVHLLGKSSGFSSVAIKNLVRLSRQISPCVIHTHNLGPLLYAGLAKLRTRRSRILHGEHAQFSSEDLRPRRILQRRLFYRFCRHIHTVSNGQKKELQQLGFPAEKIQTIINGVDTTRFCPGNPTETRMQLGMDDGFWIGIVGRFGEFKGHRALLDAFEHLAPAIPELRLLIVGGGGPCEQEVVSRIKASPAAHRIKLSGYCQDTAPYYKALDLLLVPSTNEGLSNVVLESMATGIPVLAHHACGNNEAISDGQDGFLRPMETATSIMVALKEVIANKQRLAHMGEKAREKVLVNFSLTHMARQYAALYRRMAIDYVS